jgi:hypothetical protein
MIKRVETLNHRYCTHELLCSVVYGGHPPPPPPPPPPPKHMRTYIHTPQHTYTHNGGGGGGDLPLAPFPRVLGLF